MTIQIELQIDGIFLKINGRFILTLTYRLQSQ